MDEQLESMDKSSPDFVDPVEVSTADKERRQLQMAEEFNIQRAKMKELFLQKEEEVKRVREEKMQVESELASVRQQLQQLETLRQNQEGEIQSLTLLVQETVEVSTNESNEVRQLQTRCAELEQQVTQLSRQQTQEVSLAPSVLVQAVTKSIARKLGADPDKPDTLDDSMKKAQEDTELLRSLVVPLEEEIKVLKDKLRDTDTQLQQALHTKKNKSADGQCSDTSEGRCDMCANYEAELVAEQTRSAEEATKARHAQHALKVATEELEQTASIHADTLSKWKSERSETASELAELKSRLESAEQAVSSAREAAAAAEQDTLQSLTQLTVDRKTSQEHINRLETEIAALSGKYSRKAEEMQLEEISLPSDPSELQLHALRLREELIAACVGREAAAASEDVLRAELREAVHARRQLLKENRALQEQLQKNETERQEAKTVSERMNSAEKRLQDTQAENSKLTDQVAELRLRVHSLQTELDNSEKVQQDFVRLSQSLQVQLERIREADTEVRWQHDEDVSECQSCRQHLPANKKKSHCRHCGRIFCAACLSRTVAAGPRRAPCHVCGVCHTLLERHTRPYFSTEPPHSPD